MAEHRNNTPLRGRIPLPALRTTRVHDEMAVFDRLDDFAADDSGAMEHRMPADAYEEFLVAFRALISPVSAKLRAAG
jgi:hypothetical protein